MRNWFFGKVFLKLYSDEEFVKLLFQKKMGYRLNIDNPRTFNEKLQWLKLKNKNQLMRECADKYEVRNFIRDEGLEHILNDIYDVYDKVEEIDLEKLPDKFVLKMSHGSGWNIICQDKKRINWFAWKLVLRHWMKQNLYVYGREWVYKDIRPRIISEKFIENSQGVLYDYKFFCFNGKVEFIQVSENTKKGLKINLYDKSWNLLKEKYAFKNFNTRIKKPSDLGSMISIAEQLSQKFVFVRVDLYNVEGRIIFGEMTFFPSSGFKQFEPKEFDMYLGNILKHE